MYVEWSGKMSNKYTPDEITYELFGINPADFYRAKFAHGRGPDNALDNPFCRYEIGYEGIRRLIVDLQSFLPDGGRALDVGCGAGTYGPTLLANLPGLTLYGVDMSEECLEQAQANGYSSCYLLDISTAMPFEEGHFDFVFTMDFLGHVEFRHKDFLIHEMARVTRQGGGGHHGVETAPIDYLNCNPADEADPIRRYVYVDGHIGVELGEDVCRRFSKYFTQVDHGITRLYPFKPKDAFAACFEEDFQQTVAAYDHPQAAQLADIILGRLNSYFLDLYSRVFGRAFKAYEKPSEPVDEAHARAREEMLRHIEAYNEMYGTDFIPVPRELFRPTWFSSITVKK
jgi:SAM-dependent methyltransferase